MLTKIAILETCGNRPKSARYLPFDSNSIGVTSINGASELRGKKHGPQLR